MTTMSTIDQQEVGRKRLAKLLGVAPFRVEFKLIQGGFYIEVDGRPATSEETATFQRDVTAKLKEKSNSLN